MKTKVDKSMSTQPPPKSIKWANPLLALSMGCLLTSTASADLLAYDSFTAGASNAAGEYTAEPGGGSGRHYLSGQNPILSGFTGAWTEANGSRFELGTTGGTQISSLTYTGVSSSGNAAFRSSGSGTSHRALNIGTLGDNGTTTYFSFLMKLDNASAEGRIALTEGENTFGTGLRVRSTGGNFVAQGGGIGDTILTTTDTSTHLFVWKVDFNATDNFSLYMDPTDLDVEGNNTAIYTGSATGLNPTHLTLVRDQGGNGVIFDEVRIGTAWDSTLFTNVPEPSMLGLIMLGSALLYSSRSKKKA